MNKRLLTYLRSIGLSAEATEQEAWEFYRGLRGVQCSIANALNYQEEDYAARQNCDLVIRALGYNPERPTELLEAAGEDDGEGEGQRNNAGGDGASTAGDLEAQARAAAVEAERARVAEITQVAGDDIPAELVRQACSEGWTVDRASREFLSAYRQANSRETNATGAPAVHSRNSVTGNNPDVLAAALLHRANLDPTQSMAMVTRSGAIRGRRTDTEVLERAADQAWQFAQASLVDIVRMAARCDGIQVGLTTPVEEIFASYRSAAFSTSALSNIFTTNMSSQLLAAFDAAPDSTTGGWIREADVSNFKTNERARLEKGAALSKLPRGSEADHAEYEDNVESYKIARYAQQFVVDEQDIIDDTFGGINQHTPSEMGEAARELRPDLVYSILIGNPTMRDSNSLFDATNHSNNTGSAALSIDTLGASRTRIRTQTENGRNLNLVGRFLIVPEALRDTALEITNSGVVVIAGTTDAERGAFNPQSRAGLVVVTDARLDNGVTDPTDATGATVHAGSASTWWLSAAASAHTIEVGYRSGTGRRPQLRSWVLTGGKWGIGWDINMDIGAKALSWEGLQRQQSASL